MVSASQVSPHPMIARTSMDSATEDGATTPQAADRRRDRTKMCVLAAALVVGLGGRTAWADLTYTIFDPPGSNNTFVEQLNNNGETAGTYTDSKFVTHEFVRTPDGAITTFTIAGVQQINGRSVLLDDAGEVAGTVLSGGFYHGFLRSAAGVVTTFDVPGSRDTEITAISPAGALAGLYVDGSGTTRDFVRDTSGALHTFAVPGPGGYGVLINAVNDLGTQVGSFPDSSSISSPVHGFILNLSGNVTPFDVQLPADVQNGNPPSTSPSTINNAGMIGGTFSSGVLGSHVAFFRDTSGQVTVLYPTGQPGFEESDHVTGINSRGAMSGYWTVLQFPPIHGFMSDSSQHVSEVTAPFVGPGTVHTTIVAGINDSGAMAGTVADTPLGQHFISNGHGFIATPASVPEPSTVTMAGLALLGAMGYRGWRLRRTPR